MQHLLEKYVSLYFLFRSFKFKSAYLNSSQLNEFYLLSFLLFYNEKY